MKIRREGTLHFLEDLEASYKRDHWKEDLPLNWSIKTYGGRQGSRRTIVQFWSLYNSFWEHMSMSQVISQIIPFFQFCKQIYFGYKSLRYYHCWIYFILGNKRIVLIDKHNVSRNC